MAEKKPVNTFRIVRLFLFFVLLYLVFTQYGLDHSDIEQQLLNAELVEIGHNQGKGNMVGIQPWMEPIDYASDSNFLRKIEHYFKQADEAGYLNDSTIVVLPEYLGTWLVALNERKTVYTVKESEKALRTIVFRNLFAFVGAYLNADAPDPVKASVFSMKSAQMTSVYEQTFKELAAKYQVTVVAGSILLQNPIIKDGSLQTTDGPLYNVSATFLPDSTISPNLVYKAFPIDEEKPFCSAKPADQLPVFDTPAGKLAVMICADSWYPESYETISRSDAQLLAIPSYSAGDRLWQTTWQGYNGAENPADIDTTDIGRITEEMAWLKYSMGGRAQQSNIEAGINVFLRGNIWDLGTDGKTISYHKGALKVNEDQDTATITNLWLN